MTDVRREPIPLLWSTFKKRTSRAPQLPGPFLRTLPACFVLTHFREIVQRKTHHPGYKHADTNATSAVFCGSDSEYITSRASVPDAWGQMSSVVDMPSAATDAYKVHAYVYI